MSKELLEKNIKDIEELERRKILEGMKESYLRCGVPQIDPEEYDQNDYASPTYVKMGLNEKEAAQIFLDHRYMPRGLLAEKYGAELAFFYEKRKPINIIQRIYQDVIKKPERYSEYITAEDIRDVNMNVINRAGFGSKELQSYGAAKSVKAVIASPIIDAISKMEEITDKATNIVSLKLDSYKNKKDIKSLDVKKAVDVLKVVTDLKRLEKGEATEHIAHYVKTENLQDMDTNALINVMNSHRQAEQENK